MPAEKLSIAEPYSPEELSGLILGSYKYSRGSSGAQGSIIRWLVFNYGERIERVDTEKARSIVGDSARKVVTNEKAHPYKMNESGSHTAVDDFQAKMDIDSTFNTLQRIVSDNQSARSEYSLLHDLAYSLADADYTWIKASSGRSGKYTTPLPFRSNLVRFGLLGISQCQNGYTTGREEFDNMFVATVDFILRHPQALATAPTRLKQLIEEYELHHPEAQEAIDARLAEYS